LTALFKDCFADSFHKFFGRPNRQLRISSNRRLKASDLTRHVIRVQSSAHKVRGINGKTRSIKKPASDEHRTRRDPHTFHKFPTIDGQVPIQEFNKLQNFIRITSDDRMHHFSEKTQKNLIAPVQKIEAGVEKDPVVVPILIVDSMLPDVVRSVGKSTIRGRQIPEPIQSIKESGLVEISAPWNLRQSEFVDDGPSCYFRYCPYNIWDFVGHRLSPRSVPGTQSRTRIELLQFAQIVRISALILRGTTELTSPANDEVVSDRQLQVFYS